MPVPTLIANPGASNANSYCTVSEGNVYHDSRLHSTLWLTATADTKTISLIMATRLLDAMYLWVGTPTNADQSLQWPRANVYDESRQEYLDNQIIPPELRDATAEFARQLIGADKTLESEVELNGLLSLKAGSVALTFANGFQGQSIPRGVLLLIPSWWGAIRSLSNTSNNNSKQGGIVSKGLLRG